MFNDGILKLHETYFHEAGTYGKEHFGTSFAALTGLNSADKKYCGLNKALDSQYEGVPTIFVISRLVMQSIMMITFLVR